MPKEREVGEPHREYSKFKGMLYTVNSVICN